MRESGSGLWSHDRVLPISSVATARAYMIRIVLGGMFQAKVRLSACRFLAGKSKNILQGLYFLIPYKEPVSRPCIPFCSDLKP